MSVKQLHAAINALSKARWALSDLEAHERALARAWYVDSDYCRAVGLDIGGRYSPDDDLARRIRRARLDYLDARRRYVRHGTGR